MWSIDVGTGYGSPVVSNRTVYFNHRLEDEEIVQCVDADTGDALWDFRYATDFVCDYEYSDGPIGTVMIASGHVFAVGGQGQFFCLNAEDGKLVWERNFHEEYELQDDLFATGSAPLLIDDRLIFNVGATDHEAGVIAMNATTGETLWTATDHGRSYCTPFYARIHSQGFCFCGHLAWIGEFGPEQREGGLENGSLQPSSHVFQLGFAIGLSGPRLDGDRTWPREQFA